MKQKIIILVLSLILSPILVFLGTAMILVAAGYNSAFMMNLALVIAPALLLSDFPNLNFIHNSWVLNFLLEFIYLYTLISVILSLVKLTKKKNNPIN